MGKGETAQGKTDPRTLVIVLLTMVLIIAAVGLRLWANEQRLQVPNFKAMTVAPDGRVFIVVGNTLFIESAEGESLRVLPLEEWGVRAFHGDFVVLRDGSVILAEGRLPDVGLEEGLRLYVRDAPAADDPREGLMRCHPASGKCSPLSGGGDRAQFRRAFSIDVDETAGLLHVSEPGMHRLVQLTLAGERRAVNGTGWRFPNGLRAVVPGRVGIVDTNHHRYVELPVSGEGFGGIVHEESILEWPDVDESHRFPFDAVKDSNGALWMLVADTSMDDAWLYRRPQDGRAGRLALPESADPVALAAVPGGMLAADAGTFRILRFNAKGQPERDFGSSALTNHLAALEDQHARYSGLFDYSLFAVLLIAVPALGAGLYLQYKPKPEDAVERESDIVATAEPLPAFRNVEAQFSRLQGEFIFWRKFTVLSTKESFRFGLLAAIFFAAAIGAALYLMQQVAEEDGRRFVDTLAESRMPALLALAGATLLVMWLSATFERLIVNRDGIRYRSWMPGPLGYLLPFHGHWQMRWTEIASLKLVHVARGRNQLMWRYEILAKDGRKRRIHPLSWRLAGEAETGIPLRQAHRQNPRMIRDVIQRTLLFRLLGRQWQSVTESKAEAA